MSETVTCSGCQGTGRVRVTCPPCHGSGRVMGHSETCGACNGTGRGINPETHQETGYNCVLCNGTGSLALEEDCGHCDGAGSVELQCNGCDGSGSVTIIHEKAESESEETAY